MSGPPEALLPAAVPPPPSPSPIEVWGPPASPPPPPPAPRVEVPLITSFAPSSAPASDLLSQPTRPRASILPQDADAAWQAPLTGPSPEPTPSELPPVIGPGPVGSGAPAQPPPSFASPPAARHALIDPSDVDDEGDDGDMDVTILSAQVAAKRATWGLDLPDGGRMELRGDTVVGRRPKAPEDATGRVLTIRLNDPEKMVSRSHALLRLDGDRVQVIDLNSANGTSVVAPDGQAVDCLPGQAVDAQDGATIVFAEYTVTLSRKAPTR